IFTTPPAAIARLNAPGMTTSLWKSTLPYTLALPVNVPSAAGAAFRSNGTTSCFFVSIPVLLLLVEVLADRESAPRGVALALQLPSPRWPVGGAFAFALVLPCPSLLRHSLAFEQISARLLAGGFVQPALVVAEQGGGVVDRRVRPRQRGHALRPRGGLPN